VLAHSCKTLTGQRLSLAEGTTDVAAGHLSCVLLTRRGHDAPPWSGAMIAVPAVDSRTDNMQFKALVPMLQCNDIEATKDWFSSILGFRCVGQMESRVVSAERDGVAIMCMRNDHLGAPTATAIQYMYVDDVLGLWNSLKDRCSAEWGPEQMPLDCLSLRSRISTATC
jgi:hypothetical protein